MEVDKAATVMEAITSKMDNQLQQATHTLAVIEVADRETFQRVTRNMTIKTQLCSKMAHHSGHRIAEGMLPTQWILDFGEGDIPRLIRTMHEITATMSTFIPTTNSLGASTAVLMWNHRNIQDLKRSVSEKGINPKP